MKIIISCSSTTVCFTSGLESRCRGDKGKYRLMGGYGAAAHALSEISRPVFSQGFLLATSIFPTFFFRLRKL